MTTDPPRSRPLSPARDGDTEVGTVEVVTDRALESARVPASRGDEPRWRQSLLEAIGVWGLLYRAALLPFYLFIVKGMMRTMVLRSEALKRTPAWARRRPRRAGDLLVFMRR